MTTLTPFAIPDETLTALLPDVQEYSGFTPAEYDNSDYSNDGWFNAATDVLNEYLISIDDGRWINFTLAADTEGVIGGYEVGVRFTDGPGKPDLTLGGGWIEWKHLRGSVGGEAGFVEVMQTILAEANALIRQANGWLAAHP